MDATSRISGVRDGTEDEGARAEYAAMSTDRPMRTSLVPPAQGRAGAWSNRAAKYGLDATGRPGVTKSRPTVIYQWR